MRALLMLNPKAGVGRGARVAEGLVTYLGRLGMEVELVTALDREEGVKVASQAREAWEREGWEVFLVAGGDGTINSAVQPLAGSDVTVGILPVGVGNVAARQLGLPLSLRQACQVAASGETRAVDLGVANGRPFLSMAGIGFDAAVVRSVRPEVKKRLGALAYVLRALRAATQYRYVPISVRIEGDALRGPERVEENWFVVVANGPTYSFCWKAVPWAAMDDGQLDICMFGKTSAWATGAQVIYALLGHHLALPSVRYRKAQRICIEASGRASQSASRRTCVQVDGEPAGFTPVEVSCLAGGLKVRLPGAGEPARRHPREL
jgi:YegS/Rv2252/BmrU family lipid kinase